MIFYHIFRLFASLAARFGRTKSEKQAIRARIMNKYYKLFARTNARMNFNEACIVLQNETFPQECLTSEKIIAILVPEGNFMSGGIYSMFSIAAQLRKLKNIHGFDVIVVSRPNIPNLTYFRNTHFRNYENVYRFDQLRNCDAVREICLYIPEYVADTFVADLAPHQLTWLKSRESVHINILNQNIKLMPEPKSLERLKTLTNSISVSVAHHAYFNQDMTNKYGFPTILLPAYTDLSSYPKSGFLEKHKLIIYSPDDAPHKAQCLKILRANLPEFELREIKNITFDTFMDLATRCMFSVSFGEGFDGYVAQPTLQGGIGMTVYNDDFFPSPDYQSFENFFVSDEDMLNNICAVIAHLSNTKSDYERLNAQLVAKHDALYSYDNYLSQIEKLSLKQFEIFPEFK